jgi:hypothetical protein
VEDFRFNQFVSFKAGYSQVSGSEKIEDGEVVAYTTLATAVLEGFNVLDVVTADRIVARIASSYNPKTHEHRILTTGSRFENLRIGSCDVKVHLDHELAFRLSSFEKAREEYKKNAKFKKIVDDPFDEGKKSAAKEIGEHGAIHCSLVQKFEPENGPGIFDCHGHVLSVEGFGKIYLAEVLFQHCSKTLTMIRIDLGSPTGGGVTGAQAASNGIPPGGSGKKKG